MTMGKRSQVAYKVCTLYLTCRCGINHPNPSSHANPRQVLNMAHSCGHGTPTGLGPQTHGSRALTCTYTW